jgi:hypothetical protein
MCLKDSNGPGMREVRRSAMVTTANMFTRLYRKCRRAGKVESAAVNLDFLVHILYKYPRERLAHRPLLL